MNSFPIARHLRIRTLRSPQFGPDDRSLYFRCDFTGNHEIWELSAPERWPRQRTFTGRDVTFGSWSPTGTEMAFGVARSDDERAQVGLLDDESETVRWLTDEPDVVHRWGGWSHDGATFAYAANRRNPGIFDVYTQALDGSQDEARLVYEHDRSSSVHPVGWGPADDRLLVLETHSNYNADLHLVDLESGETSMLTSGPETEARYRSIRWGPRGRSLYLVTDHDHDWLYVARLDLDSGDLEPVVRHECNVRELVLHAGRERLVYRTDERGYDEVVAGRLVAPTEIERFPAPDLPTGAAESLTMSSDGERVVTVYYTPNTMPNLYAIEVETGDVTRWTDTSQPVPADNFVPPESTTYESFDGLEIPSLYVEPESGDEALPAIIDLHSGPRQRNTPSPNPIRQYYVERGFARLEPNYRGSAGFGKPYMALDDREKRFDAIADVKAAADWLAERDGVDGDRIVLMGRSYGGFLVLAAMTRWPDRFAAGVAISPIANFETFLENTSPWRRENREAEYGSLDDDREFLRDLSPIHDVEALQSPLLVVHGTEDRIVPIDEAEQVAAIARSNDVPVETLFIEGTGHGFRSRDDRIELFERAATFLGANT